MRVNFQGKNWGLNGFKCLNYSANDSLKTRIIFGLRKISHVPGLGTERNDASPFACSKL